MFSWAPGTGAGFRRRASREGPPGPRGEEAGSEACGRRPLDPVQTFSNSRASTARLDRRRPHHFGRALTPVSCGTLAVSSRPCNPKSPPSRSWLCAHSGSWQKVKRQTKRRLSVQRHSVLKRKETLTPAAAWMSREDRMLSGPGQSQMDTYGVTSPVRDRPIQRHKVEEGAPGAGGGGQRRLLSWGGLSGRMRKLWMVARQCECN